MSSDKLNEIIKSNEQTLKKQSRSFAIPILQLEAKFRLPIMVEYNLNKTIDTIEDSMQVANEEKIALIQEFCQSLQQGQASTHIKQRMTPITPAEETFVFKNYDATIALYNSLSETERNLAQKWTFDMANGMCEFLKKDVFDLDDLNAYCYYAAGSVGLYLTDILHINGNNMNEEVYNKLNTNAVAFGLFLQKLNIIRDYNEDKYEHKRSFWPSCYFEQGMEPLDILNFLCHQTLETDVPRAIQYCEDLPEGNESYDALLRFILSSGIEYIKVLKNNRSVFSKIKVKLPKMFIKGLYERVAKLSRVDFINYCRKLHEQELSFYTQTS